MKIKVFTESGQSLILVTVMLFIILYIALATVVRTTSNTSISHGQSNSSQALSLALSGVQEAELYVQSPNSNSNIISGSISNTSKNASNVCDRLNLSGSAANCNYFININPKSTSDFFIPSGGEMPVNLDYIDSTGTVQPCGSPTNTNCSNIYITVTLPAANSNNNGNILVNFFSDTGKVFYIGKFYAYISKTQITVPIPFEQPDYCVAYPTCPDIYPDSANIIFDQGADVQVSVY